MDKRYFSQIIVKWYQANKRELPWRQTNDPYKIWLSEIILQQTRVIQGLPYYERFVDKYPSVNALAAAPEQDVLRLWQGLGYYTRARNLHKCANSVMNDHNGKFPSSFAGLIELPGVGEYTAAAIASFSYKETVAVVDGNVFRVLSRIFGIETPINSLEGKKIFSALAAKLIDPNQPDLHNQAMMEFGAMFCTPKNPACESCIFKKQCVAYRGDLQSELPVKLKGKSSRKRYFYYLVWEKDGKLMMKKREGKDIWNGLFDFNLIEKNRLVKPERLIDEILGVNPSGKKPETVVSKSYKHILSHQTIFTRFIILKNFKKRDLTERGNNFYSFKEIAKLPKPVLVARFLSDYYPL
jgi:A/G-specific adenine glycosylase